MADDDAKGGFFADLFAPVAGETFDLVTANPPYIPRGDVPGLDPDIREFEPHLALVGGDDGLDVVRALVKAAPAHLAPDGVLALEQRRPVCLHLIGFHGFRLRPHGPA